MHTYIICIGSNYNKEENLLLAKKHLAALYPSIIFADKEETEPLFFHNSELFINQVACFETDKEIEQVQEHLKNIERLARRLPEDKAKEIVRLDIDLLSCDDQVFKPDDMERNYIKRGIRQIHLKFI